MVTGSYDYYQKSISSKIRDPSQEFTGYFSRGQVCVSEENVSQMEISVLMRMVPLVSSQNASANSFCDEIRSPGGIRTKGNRSFCLWADEDLVRKTRPFPGNHRLFFK